MDGKESGEGQPQIEYKEEDIKCPNCGKQAKRQTWKTRQINIVVG